MFHNILTSHSIITTFSLVASLAVNPLFAFATNFDSVSSSSTPTVIIPANIRDSIDCDYLIITSALFSNDPSLIEFADHHADYDSLFTVIVTIDQIYDAFQGNRTPYAIKNFLTYAYDNWNTSRSADDKLLYVLLVGEGDSESETYIPTYTYQVLGDSMKSDHWYACLDDDNFDGMVNDNDMSPDLMIGRFSVESHQELESIVAKTIHHNLSDWSSPWRKEIYLFSSFNEKDERLIIHDLYDLILNFIDLQNYFHIPEVVKLKTMTKDDFTDRFNRVLNQGCGIINLNAHGNIDSWSDGQGWIYFTNDDVSNLSNQNRYPIILNFSCKSGNFTSSDKDCLGELLVNQPDRGAVAFWGATASNDGSRAFNEALMNSLILHDNIPIGYHLKLAREIANPAKCYNLLGDPALRIRKTLVNQFIDVTANPEDVYLYADENFQTNNYIFEIPIFNRGFHPAKQIRVIIHDNPPETGGTILLDEIIPEIRPHNGSYKLSFSISSINSKIFNYHVDIDPDNTIIEYDESNNRFSDSTLISIFSIQNNRIEFNKYVRSDLPFFYDYNSDDAIDFFMFGSTSVLYKNMGLLNYAAIAPPPAFPYLNSIKQAFTLDLNNNRLPEIFLNSLITDTWLILYDITTSSPWGQYVMTNETLVTDNGVLGFIDIDNNGYLEILIDEEPYILWHDEDDSYIASDPKLPESIKLRLQHASFADFDQDLFCDMFVVDAANKGYLLHNNGDSTFSDVSTMIDFDVNNYISKSLFQDFNNDMDLDLFLIRSRFNEPVILQYKDEQFIKADYSFTPPLSKRLQLVHCFDYDNDGFADLFVSEGQSIGELYHNDNNFHFHREISFMSDRIPEDIKGFAISDIDDDGDTDLFITFSKSHPSFLFMSNMQTQNNWIKLELSGTRSNGMGMGANVQVCTASGNQLRQNSFVSNNGFTIDPLISFGLGDADRIDSMVIRWPSGIIDVMHNVKINTTITIKEGYGNTEIPTRTEIVQNYPNPFNDFTKIMYRVEGNPHQQGESHSIRIVVYNILGQEVASLVNRRQTSGRHSIQWDGRDKNGQSLPTGVYLLVLDCDHRYDRHKLLILR